MITELKEKMDQVYPLIDNVDWFSSKLFMVHTGYFRVTRHDDEFKEEIGKEFAFTQWQLDKMLKELRAATSGMYPFKLKGDPQERYSQDGALDVLVILRKENLFYVRSNKTKRAFKPEFFNNPIAIPQD